jgi:hypothetical protein
LALVQRISAVESKCISSADEARKSEAVRRVEEFVEIKRQWRDINTCQSQFSQSYVQDNQFIPIWVEGLRIVQEALGSNNMSSNHIQKRSVYIGILARYEKLACSLRDKLVDTARQGLLKEEILFSIQERWLRLDDLLDWYYDMHNNHLDEDTPPVSRSTPTWLV